MRARGTYSVPSLLTSSMIELRNTECLSRARKELAFEDGLGNTPLHMAVNGGHSDVVEVLLAAGADVNAVNGGQKTVLMCAVSDGPVERIVDMLVRSGCDIFKCDWLGNSAMSLAAAQGAKRVVELLLETANNLATKNVDGGEGSLFVVTGNFVGVTNSLDPALFFASMNGHYEVVEMLLNAGANPHFKYGDQTSLDVAIRNQRLEVIEVLRKYD
jgi:ankyrin repeat protein